MTSSSFLSALDACDAKDGLGYGNTRAYSRGIEDKRTHCPQMNNAAKKNATADNDIEIVSVKDAKSKVQGAVQDGIRQPTEFRLSHMSTTPRVTRPQTVVRVPSSCGFGSQFITYATPETSSGTHVSAIPEGCVGEQITSSEKVMVIYSGGKWLRTAGSGASSSDAKELTPARVEHNCTHKAEAAEVSESVLPLAQLDTAGNKAASRRQWKHADPTLLNVNGTLRRRALDDTPSFSRPNGDECVEDEANVDKLVLAVCPYCGTTSHDFQKCESCRRPLDKAKLYTPSDESRSQSKRSAMTFYGSSRFNELKVTEEEDGEEEESSVQEAQKAKHRRLVTACSSEAACGRERKVKPRGRRNGRLTLPPVTVVLSSDDEMADNDQDVSDRLLSDAGEPLLCTKNRLPSPSGELDDDLFPEILPGPVSRSTLTRRCYNPLPCTVLPRAGATPRGDSGEQTDGIGEAPAASEELELRVRVVRIGTLKSSEIDRPALLSERGLDLSFKCKEGSSIMLRIDIRDIDECLAHMSRKMAVLIITTTPGFGARVRSKLRMTDPAKPYFDPRGKDESHRNLVVNLDAAHIASCLVELTDKISDIFRCAGIRHKNGHVLFKLLSYAEANKRLLIYLPTDACVATPVRDVQQQQRAFESQDSQGMTDAEEQSSEVGATQQEGLTVIDTVSVQETEAALETRELRPRKLPVFSGPVKRLFLYPFSSATRRITVTNEDIVCLEEGEFLNDVVVDFYLKYLVEERLSAEDKRRTHVFSSFFYMRLVQNPAASACDKRAEEEHLTMKERRHNRVKTWTRQVDLFDKDFVVVPINERAHWFLAVICFPSLLACTSSAPRNSSVKSRDRHEQHCDEPSETSGKGDAEEEEDEDLSPAAEEDDNGPSAACSSSAAGDVDNEEDGGEDSTMAAADGSPSAGRNNGMSKRHRPCILIFDSLAGASRSSNVRILREYLEMEWNAKKKSLCTQQQQQLVPPVFSKDSIPGICAICPQQDNYCDCGVFLLQYVESFFETPILDYCTPTQRLEDWFSMDVIRGKRLELINLMRNIAQHYEKIAK